LPVMHHITLQSMATCCDTSQHIAMHGNTLWCIAMHRST
jgi:hypothetical protein